MKFVFDDGGRSAAGYRGLTGDCGVRAVSIASGRSYQEVYDAINEVSKSEHPKKHKRSSSRTGVHTQTMKKYISSIGGRWVPTMQIGSGCKVHLIEQELPSGKLVVRIAHHYVAVINGVVHDTFDSSNNGFGPRCVYGYWVFS